MQIKTWPPVRVELMLQRSEKGPPLLAFRAMPMSNRRRRPAYLRPKNVAEPADERSLSALISIGEDERLSTARRSLHQLRPSPAAARRNRLTYYCIPHEYAWPARGRHTRGFSGRASRLGPRQDAGFGDKIPSPTTTCETGGETHAPTIFAPGPFSSRVLLGFQPRRQRKPGRPLGG